MAKSPYTPKQQLDLVKRYLAGEASYRRLAIEYGISEFTLQKWTARYREHGAKAFYRSLGNASYSKEFKIKCVEAVLSGKASVNAIVAKYNISARSVLRSWILKYTANIELTDYEPKREVYMAEAHRKTTLEERQEIVEHCMTHGNDYKGTAVRYDVSYHQVYDWVRRYREHGDDGLLDKRGRRKKDDELSELERLQRENKRLKRQLDEAQMLNMLLKKVQEFEGR